MCVQGRECKQIKKGSYDIHLICMHEIYGMKSVEYFIEIDRCLYVMQNQTVNTAKSNTTPFLYQNTL